MTAKPQVFAYTPESQSDADVASRADNVVTMTQIYPFAMFACYWTIVYRLVAHITAERESGITQLVDAMGGGLSAPMARVASWLLTYNLACLPLFIGFGGLYWHILFTKSDVGSLIGWQILQGVAVNNASVFASAFFSKSRVSAIYVIGAFLLTSVGAQVYSFQYPVLPTATGVYTLTVLFASSNFVYFLQQMALWEIAGQKARFSILPEASHGINSTSYGVTQSTMLIFLAIHIVVFPLLAIITERLIHGIDFRHRSFVKAKDNSSGTFAVETFDLKKRFEPSLFDTLLNCRRRKPVLAVDGIYLQSHPGQILCLVGPNGSGKTTTLQIMAGFTSPTAGTVRLAATPSQIGIAPQKNILWDTLTVQEHLLIWSKIKSSDETSDDLQQLAMDCDIANKSKSLTKILSGGQMRKLQLACAFVGNPSICLIDECTSGLDPLSRQAIWDILLHQRSKRSILLTTHFLDEVDVLADHIVILSKGKIRCQGTPAELKTQYGSGYRVSVPRSNPRVALDIPYPRTEFQDSRIYTTPDSNSCAKLLSELIRAGMKGASMCGPQIEDVFLNVADEPELFAADKKIQGMSQESERSSGPGLTPASVAPFSRQVGILFRKRCIVLKKFWWAYLYVIALPIIITYYLGRRLISPGSADISLGACAPNPPQPPVTWPDRFTRSPSCYGTSGLGCDHVALGPKFVQDELDKIIGKGLDTVKTVGKNETGDFSYLCNSQNEFHSYFDDMINREISVGGIYQEKKRRRGHTNWVLIFRQQLRSSRVDADPVVSAE